MSDYTLNDVMFDATPLSLFQPNPTEQIDEEELQKIFQKNREITERLERAFQNRILESAKNES